MSGRLSVLFSFFSLFSFILVLLRSNRPSFNFLGEAGYGQGVDREAWEMIAGDLVLPFPPPSPPLPLPQHQKQEPDVEEVSGRHSEKRREAFFVPVEEGMSSYCPRFLHGNGEGTGAGGGGSGGGAMQIRQEREKDLQAFEMLGIVIGAHLSWDKVYAKAEAHADAHLAYVR